jgi:flagellar L-ring protein FlgH
MTNDTTRRARGLKAATAAISGTASSADRATCSALGAVGTICATLLALASATPAAAQSLYDEASYRALTADNKAFRIGDVLTVQVVENASAVASADSGSHRKNSAGLELFRDSSNFRRDLGVATTGDFDGGGRTSRAGKLVTQMSVTVTEVLSNGDLRVSGEQSLVINQEKQQIRVTGQVRPQDITDGNVVLSSRIADATIDYDGAGTLTDSQRVPWWQRVRSWFGL